MYSLQLRGRAELCSDIEVIGVRFHVLVDRLDFSINVIGSLKRNGRLDQILMATLAAEECLPV